MRNSKQSNLSEREKLMLPTAFAIIALVLYGAFRWKPANQSIAELKTELTSAIQGRDGLKFPSLDPQNAAELKPQLESLEEALKVTSEALERSEESLVNIHKGSSFQSLKIQISSLAQESGLTIIESVPYGSEKKSRSGNNLYIEPSRAPASKAPSSAPVIHEFFQTLYARPLQVMTVQSTFSALLNFVNGLDSLSWRVTLVSFDIEADIQDQQSVESLSPPKLTSNILLSF